MKLFYKLTVVVETGTCVEINTHMQMSTSKTGNLNNTSGIYHAEILIVILYYNARYTIWEKLVKCM